MENEKMDAIDRALLHLAKATYENRGAGVVARIVPAGKGGGRGMGITKGER